MLQYLIAVIVIISIIYNQYRKPKIEKNENERIEHVISKFGMEDIMKTLKDDKSYNKSTEELDKILSELERQKNDEKKF